VSSHTLLPVDRGARSTQVDDDAVKLDDELFGLGAVAHTVAVPAAGAGDAATDDDGDGGTPPRRRRRWRAVFGPVATGLALLLVLGALTLPNLLPELQPSSFARIPVEALVGLAVLLVLPGRPRRVVAAVAGALLGLVVIVKCFDMGFYWMLDRPFDPYLDLSLARPGVEFLDSSFGRAGAVAAAIGIVALAIGLVVVMSLSVLRVTRLAVRHRRPATGVVAVLAIAWAVCAVAGVETASGLPVADRNTALLAYGDVRQVRVDIRDGREFRAQAEADRFVNTPPDQLLTALRGKDVVLAFVESYGRSVIEDPELSAGVDPVLDAGTAQLAAAGFGMRSAFLTSPTTGSGSWLAHSTLVSGLWVSTEQRYRTLVASDRFTLNQAFGRMGTRPIAFMPGVTRAWPEGEFFGYDKIYGKKDMGYRGPNFAWAPMPDQYTLSALQRMELGKPDHAPTMVEMPLLSSHIPWTPLPWMVDWDTIGDGRHFAAQARAGEKPAVVMRDPAKVRSQYAKSIQYSLTALTQWMQRYGTEDTVLVFLGDHQPAPIVVGNRASRDVPITIVAKDPKVLDRIADWGWQPGLNPDPSAPVWRMDAFRDRFLTAFGSTPTP
jgi:hypothetical protein